MSQLTFWSQESADKPAPDKPTPAPSRPKTPGPTAGTRPIRAKKVQEAAAWTLTNLPPGERPINRLLSLGPSALSTTELLAILLGNTTQLQDAGNLLAGYGNLAGVARASTIELKQRPHIGEAVTARIKAAFELGRRLITESDNGDHPQVRSPADAANLVMSEMMTLEQEHLKVLLLDTKNRVMHVTTLYVGSLNTSLIRVGEIFRDAIRGNAAAVIVVHNHPSGDPTPSPEDVAVTRMMVEAGKLIDIEVLDHLIIGNNRWTSMKERGLGFA